jgi:PPOX class probable FMN-dependent enzyme
MRASDVLPDDANQAESDVVPTRPGEPPADRSDLNLDALYVPPAEMIQKAVLNRLVDFHELYLQQATFFCLATGSEAGLDASPRGGPPGFVHVLDEHTVAFADWPGNNRIESMRNLQRDDRVGMLFIFPGLEIFLRINGRARVSTDSALLARLGEGQKQPKAATVVAVKEVLLHCGKAVNRAKLWAEGSRLDREQLPSVGKMMAAITKLADAQNEMGEEQIEQVNAHYDQAIRNNLY